MGDSDDGEATFYHVTRSGREEGVFHEGLRPDLMDDRWERPRGRKAVFLWGSLRSAYRAIDSEAFNGTLDGSIVRVRIPRSWAYPDETYPIAEAFEEAQDEPEDRFVCFRHIPPERLSIVHIWDDDAAVLHEGEEIDAKEGR